MTQVYPNLTNFEFELGREEGWYGDENLNDIWYHVKVLMGRERG